MFFFRFKTKIIKLIFDQHLFLKIKTCIFFSLMISLIKQYVYFIYLFIFIKYMKLTLKKKKYITFFKNKPILNIFLFYLLILIESYIFKKKL